MKRLALMAVAVNLSLAASLGASWFHIDGDGFRICSVVKNAPNPYPPTYPVGPVAHLADFPF